MLRVLKQVKIMRANCNKCNKEVDCNNEIRRTDKVIIFDDLYTLMIKIVMQNSFISM